MWKKGRFKFGLRALFIAMIVVAHASAKPQFAKRLHASKTPEVVSTLTPFHITIRYDEDEGETTHEETFVGLLGWYWMTSRSSTFVCRCCCFESPGT
jgi:hypothetical protein